MSLDVFREILTAFISIVNALQLAGWILNEGMPKTARKFKERFEMDSVAKVLGCVFIVCMAIAALLGGVALLLMANKPSPPINVVWSPPPAGYPQMPSYTPGPHVTPAPQSPWIPNPNYRPPRPNGSLDNGSPTGSTNGSLIEKGPKEATKK